MDSNNLIPSAGLISETIPFVPEGYTIGTDPAGRRYIVPTFMIPATHQAFEAYRKKAEMNVFGAAGGVSLLPHPQRSAGAGACTRHLVLIYYMPGLPTLLVFQHTGYPFCLHWGCQPQDAIGSRTGSSSFYAAFFSLTSFLAFDRPGMAVPPCRGEGPANPARHLL
jgi:hypothetical protein